MTRAELAEENERLRELLRNVVMDYGPQCCDAIGACDCSMGRAAREIQPPSPIAADPTTGTGT